MTYRQTASTGNFLATQTGSVMVSTIASLTDFVPSGTHLRPMAIALDETPPVDLLVSQVVIRSEKNPEVQHRIYKGPLVKLSTVMASYASTTNRLGALTPQEFIADHGLEIVMTYDNGSSALNPATFLWDIQNQPADPTGGLPHGLSLLAGSQEGAFRGGFFAPLGNIPIRGTGAVGSRVFANLVNDPEFK